MNKNYAKGRRFEYKLIKEIRNKGGIAIRSAGSHGLVDVVGIFPKQNIIVLYQCKTDAVFNGKEKQEVEEMYKAFKESKIPVCFNLVYMKDRKMKEKIVWAN